jgi:hypothetical protein
MHFYCKLYVLRKYSEPLTGLNVHNSDACFRILYTHVKRRKLLQICKQIA